MTIKAFCNHIGLIKQEFYSKLTEEKEDFLHDFIYKNVVSIGETVLDETGFKFKVSKVTISEVVQSSISIEIYGFRVLKSGYISKKGFVKMISSINCKGEFTKNKIVECS